MSGNTAGRNAELPAGLLDQLDGQMKGVDHLYPLLAQYEDTDAGGIVYHSAYLNYAERGRSAFLRLHGIDLADWLEQAGQTIVVRQLNISYESPARLGDRVLVRSTLRRVTPVRAEIRQIIENAADGHIFARLLVEGVWVRVGQGASRVPAEVRAVMEGLLSE